MQPRDGGLAVEADRQILPDGAGAEQSIAYQMFTAELLSLVVLLSICAAIGCRRSWSGHSIAAPDMSRSRRYPATRSPGTATTMTVSHSGWVPSRNARSASTSESWRRPPEHRRCRYGVRHSPPRGSRRPAAHAHRRDRCACRSGIRRQSFYAPNGGLVVLRNDVRRLTMDVGPLGYLSIAAHGHADALAVTLSVEGRELIVDPGTGSYYGKPHGGRCTEAPARTPRSCVDGVDQSVIGGPFYWRRHAATTVRSVDLERGIVDAEHDGYRRLDDPVVHRRWLIAPPGDATVRSST